MAITQLDKKNILDNTLTGASFIHEIGIWDETHLYNVGDEVIWNSRRYKCTATSTTATEGDISNRPDLSIDWDEITQTISLNTFAKCTNGIEQLINNTEIPILLSNSTSTTQVTIDENNRKFIINQDGVYRITQKINIKNGSNARQSATTYMKLNGSMVSSTRLHLYSRNNNTGYASGFVDYTNAFSAGDEIQFAIIDKSTTNNVKVIGFESYFEAEYMPNAVI